jgi:hypothetical protein
MVGVCAACRRALRIFWSDSPVLLDLVKVKPRARLTGGVKLVSQHMPIPLPDLLVTVVSAARRRLVAVSLCAALFGCTVGERA